VPCCQVGHPGQVALQQRPVDVGQPVDVDDGQELAEADEGIQAGVRRSDTHTGGQPQTHPSFAELAQPGLGDAIEAQPPAGAGLASAGGDARQLVQPPDVAGVLDLPADPVAQRLGRVAGVEDEQGGLAQM